MKEFYNGLCDEQIEKYRQEVRERWGEDTLKENEGRHKLDIVQQTAKLAVTTMLEMIASVAYRTQYCHNRCHSWINL